MKQTELYLPPKNFDLELPKQTAWTTNEIWKIAITLLFLYYAFGIYKKKLKFYNTWNCSLSNFHIFLLCRTSLLNLYNNLSRVMCVFFSSFLIIVLCWIRPTTLLITSQPLWSLSYACNQQHSSSHCNMYHRCFTGLVLEKKPVYSAARLYGCSDKTTVCIKCTVSRSRFLWMYLWWNFYPYKEPAYAEFRFLGFFSPQPMP